MAITLESKWEELNTIAAWQQWLELARKTDEWLFEYWTDLEACQDCKHFSPLFHWCKLQGMPNTFNPVMRCLGMACMGAGLEPIE